MFNHFRLNYQQSEVNSTLIRFDRIWIHVVVFFVFIHFYCASHRRRFSEALSTIHVAIDTVSEFTRRSATGNCTWRTCSRSLHGGESGIRTHDPSVERRRLYQCTTMSMLAPWVLSRHGTRTCPGVSLGTFWHVPCPQRALLDDVVQSSWSSVHRDPK